MDRQYAGEPGERRPAALHPDHPQGQLQHRRHADDRRQRQHEGFGAAADAFTVDADAQGRRADPRQGEPAGVRARRHVGEQPRRAGAQSRTTSRARPAARAAAPASRSPRTSRCSAPAATPGQSIRSPASANNLVGIRPTRGLVSRAGVIPNSLTQDEIGPITRTVTDAALLLDVMAGYDPADPDHRVRPRAHPEELHAAAEQGRAERRAHRRDDQHVRAPPSVTRR